MKRKPDEPTPAEEAKIIHDVITTLGHLNSDSRRRILQTVATYFDIPSSVTSSERRINVEMPTTSSPTAAGFSNHEDISPKDFLRAKRPITDVERVACLAFYLSHYRGMPNFKTLDISKLNTEAAQPKFSNPSLAISNASRTGYVTDAAKGSKQISASGEQFVLALPDRVAAKEAMHSAGRRRGKKLRPAKQSQ